MLVRAKSTEKQWMGWVISAPPHFEGIIFHFSIIFKPVSIDIPLGLYVKKRSTIKNFTLFRKLTEIERKIRSGENIFSPSEKIFLTQKKYCPSTKWLNKTTPNLFFPRKRVQEKLSPIIWALYGPRQCSQHVMGSVPHPHCFSPTWGGISGFHTLRGSFFTSRSFLNRYQ